MKHLPLKNRNYTELQKKYSLYLERIGYHKQTCRLLPSMTREFFHFLEGRSVEDLKRVSSKEIMEYYQYLKTRPNYRGAGSLSQSMQHMHIWNLRILFSYLLKEGTISVDPMGALKFPRPEKKERLVLSEKEIERLYKASECFKDRALLGLFYGCGLRKSEAEALNVRDISFKGRVLYVRSGKGKRRRVIPLPGRVIEDLKGYYYQERVHVVHKQPGGAKDTQLAFLLNKTGTRMMGQSLWKRLRYLTLKSGVKDPQRVTLHCLRHSIATHLLERGVGIEQVRDFLGHTHLESTQGYTRVNQKHLTDSLK